MWYGIRKPYQGLAAEGVSVDVPHGASSRHVAALLKSNGVVRSALAFEIYARRHPKRTPQAGDYYFSHAMTGREVFWKLAEGQVYQHPFTVRAEETMLHIPPQLQSSN